ncbi:MAG TPA: ATP-binding cassette domain-containing protein [Streptosporangiaceae bacterium]|jgi:ABC-2 type transport system ATP-binding protein|nr:ATP-binding cassette domain-containing protein [Streptosporangiaceae bacterium]
MSETLAIEAHGLAKTYGTTRALDGLDLEVQPGAILGLLGPNGAGKTTAVRVLTTLLRPDRGSAKVAGFDLLTQPDQVRRRIGLTGQYAALDEYLTGRANLIMIGQLGRLSGRDSKARATELLARFDLTDAADRGVKTYSGGMRRRLDLAASLITRPEILFLDEPTTGLDLPSRMATWDSVRELAAEGTTVLLTTQYLDEAEQLANRIAVVDRGQVIAEGTPAELKAKIGGERIRVTVAAGSSLSEAASVLAGHSDELPMVDLASRAVDAAVTSAARQLPAIVRDLDAAGVLLDDLAIRHPSLDDVFLTLTGHLTELDAADGAHGADGAHPVTEAGLTGPALAQAGLAATHVQERD